MDRAVGPFAILADRFPLLRPTDLQRLLIKTSICACAVGGTAVMGIAFYAGPSSWLSFAGFGISVATGWLADLGLKLCWNDLAAHEETRAGLARYQQATITYWKTMAQNSGSRRGSALPFVGEAGRGRGQNTSPAADTVQIIRPENWQR